MHEQRTVETETIGYCRGIRHRGDEREGGKWKEGGGGGGREGRGSGKEEEEEEEEEKMKANGKARVDQKKEPLALLPCKGRTGQERVERNFGLGPFPRAVAARRHHHRPLIIARPSFQHCHPIILVGTANSMRSWPMCCPVSKRQSLPHPHRSNHLWSHSPGSSSFCLPTKRLQTRVPGARLKRSPILVHVSPTNHAIDASRLSCSHRNASPDLDRVVAPSLPPASHALAQRTHTP